MTNAEISGRILRRVLATPIRVKLYDVLAGNGDVLELPEKGGYRDQVITASDWQVVTSTPTPFADGPLLRFVFDGTMAVDVLGAYMVNDGDGGILWIQPFEQPLKIRRAGDTIPVQPHYALSVLSSEAM